MTIICKCWGFLTEIAFMVTSGKKNCQSSLLYIIQLSSRSFKEVLSWPQDEIHIQQSGVHTNNADETLNYK